MSVMWPVRSSLHRGATRMPVAMASIESGIHHVHQGRVGAVQADQGERERVVAAGAAGRRARPSSMMSTVPAGPTSTRSSWTSSAPVSGSHSSGGHSTRSPQRMPRIRCWAKPVRNAPITGPRDRLYGKLDGRLGHLCHVHPLVVDRVGVAVVMKPSFGEWRARADGNRE